MYNPLSYLHFLCVNGKNIPLNNGVSYFYLLV